MLCEDGDDVGDFVATVGVSDVGIVAKIVVVRSSSTCLRGYEVRAAATKSGR